MPRTILPESFISILRQLRPVFTSPSFASFVVLVAGFTHALGGHRITDALRAAGGTATKHYTSYYRFFSHGRWSLDELGFTLFGVIVEALNLGDEVELVLDDTLARRSGKKVALASMHADPLLKSRSRQPFMSYGHVFIVLAVHVRVSSLGKTGWALPLMFRLFEAKSQGGREDSPSDSRRRLARERLGKARRSRVRKTDQEVVDGKLRLCEPKQDTGPLPAAARLKKTEHAAEMICKLAKRFPKMQFRILADHLYNGRNVLRPLLSKVDNVHVISRGRPDAALFGLPLARKPGERGRPRVKGKRLPTPEQWAASNPGAFKTTTVTMYGREVTVQIASMLGMAYRSLPGRLLKYVIVKDPDGIYQTAYLLCTDIELADVTIAEGYSRRWPLERTFQECKQKLCVERTQTQLPASVRRSVPFGMLLYSLVVLWWITVGHAEASLLGARPHDPWYRRTGRASFSEMLAGLRRVSWAESITDLPSQGPPRQEILVEYLARVVAAA